MTHAADVEIVKLNRQKQLRLTPLLWWHYIMLKRWLFSPLIISYNSPVDILQVVYVSSYSIQSCLTLTLSYANLIYVTMLNSRESVGSLKTDITTLEVPCRGRSLCKRYEFRVRAGFRGCHWIPLGLQRI